MIQIADGILLEEGWVRFFGFRVQTRMTVVRLADDRLWLHSPTFLTPSTRARLEELGRVAFVVSPNKIHNQALAQVAEAFPDAKLFAPPGLPERRPALRFDGVLGDAPEPGWAEELDQVVTRGNIFFSEVLFFHRRTRTLIVGDLVERMDRQTASRTALILAGAFGVVPRPRASPEFRFYTTDADAAAESLQRAQAWPIERIVIAHGAPIEEDAAEVFREVCDELVAEVRARSRVVSGLFSLLARLQ